MEDILAVVVVLALVVAFTFGVKAIIRKIAEKKAEQKRKQEESDKFWESERVRIKKVAQEKTLARLANIQNNAPPPKTLNVVASGTNVGKTTYFSSPTQQVSKPTYSAPQPKQSSDDGFLSGMVTGMLVDDLMRSISHKSGGENPIDFPREERSIGVTKTESSWGFDDSESRKSVSSSMDTSSSWSSSSDSSSDSGPSSDW